MLMIDASSKNAESRVTSPTCEAWLLPAGTRQGASERPLDDIVEATREITRSAADIFDQARALRRHRRAQLGSVPDPLEESAALRYCSAAAPTRWSTISLSSALASARSIAGLD